MYVPTQSQPDEPHEEFDAALAALGLQVGTDTDEADGSAPEPPSDKCYLWPCNLAVFNLWQRVQTQWRTGMAGNTGLDYAAVIAYMRDVAGVKRSEHAAMFKGVQAMEFAALEVWADNKN